MRGDRGPGCISSSPWALTSVTRPSSGRDWTTGIWWICTYTENLDDFFQRTGAQDIWLATAKASRPYTEVRFQPDCYLLFGKESTGLPQALREQYAQRCIRIPIREGARCLNLSNSAAILAFEALRQWGFPGLETAGEMAVE